MILSKISHVLLYYCKKAKSSIHGLVVDGLTSPGMRHGLLYCSNKSVALTSNVV